jgi:hypothetical protein
MAQARRIQIAREEISKIVSRALEPGTEQHNKLVDDILQGILEVAGGSDDVLIDQMSAVLANLPRFNDYSEFDGKAFGRLNPLEMMTREEKVQRKKIQRKRAREQESNVDLLYIRCPKCNLPREDRLNPNKFALDDSFLGSGFDYNFDNRCSCPNDRGSSDRSSSPDDGGSSDTSSSDGAE